SLVRTLMRRRRTGGRQAADCARVFGRVGQLSGIRSEAAAAAGRAGAAVPAHHHHGRRRLNRKQNDSLLVIKDYGLQAAAMAAARAVESPTGRATLVARSDG